jgi:hypothetical protein
MARSPAQVEAQKHAYRILAQQAEMLAGQVKDHPTLSAAGKKRMKRAFLDAAISLERRAEGWTRGKPLPPKNPIRQIPGQMSIEDVIA